MCGRRAPGLLGPVHHKIRGAFSTQPHRRPAAWHMHQVAEAALYLSPTHATPTAPASQAAVMTVCSCAGTPTWSGDPYRRRQVAARWLSNERSHTGSHTLVTIYRNAAHRSSPSTFLSSSHVTHPKRSLCEWRGYLPCPRCMKPTNGSRRSPPLAHCYPESRADRSLPPLEVERSRMCAAKVFEVKPSPAQPIQHSFLSGPGMGCIQTILGSVFPRNGRQMRA